MRVLGLRHLVQATVVGGRGRRVRSGALVDLIHGTSMLLLACIDTQRRRAALVDAGVAFAFAAGGVTAARENVGAFAECNRNCPHVFRQTKRQDAPKSSRNVNVNLTSALTFSARI